MQYLLDTVETIPAGVGLPQFGLCHLLWLAGFVLFTLACCRYYCSQDGDGRKRVRLAFAAALIGDELLKMTVLFHKIGPKYYTKYQSDQRQHRQKPQTLGQIFDLRRNMVLVRRRKRNTQNRAQKSVLKLLK